MNKSKHRAPKKMPTVSVAREVDLASEEIAARAYAIWEQEGRPEGREVTHWLAAEAQLRQDRSLSTPPP